LLAVSRRAADDMVSFRHVRGPANTQIVRDLRNLRDAAFTLWSCGRHDDCERLLANIRELIAGPPIRVS
jgi:hypothetical protein